MLQNGSDHDPVLMSRKWFLVILMSAVMGIAIAAGALVGFSAAERHWRAFVTTLLLVPLVPVLAYVIYKKTIYPYYRRLEDANLELHIKQEELLDTKDDLFIKFLGVYDVNYAANSPRLFANRLNDVADITARVMEADRCHIFLYDKKTDDLFFAAANEALGGTAGKVRIPLGEGVEGWVGRRLEHVMLKDLRRDSRFRDIPDLDLARYQSVFCVPLYVYSNGALMGIIEVLYGKPRSFRDEEVNFFTTLSGILSTTIQNEQMQSELRRMNMELEQWVMEKTEELRASEERYRTLVENACESIFLLAENGDIVFANDQAANLSGVAKYDLIRKNLFDLVIHPGERGALLSRAGTGEQTQWQGELRKANGAFVPVEVLTNNLTLMGKRFIQCVIRDRSSLIRLEKLLAEKESEIATLRSGQT